MSTPDLSVLRIMAQNNIELTATISKRVYNGTIRVWRTGGLVGMSDTLRRLCPVTGCVGVLDTGFALTEAQHEQIVKEGGDPDEITSWQPWAREVFHTWYASPVQCPVCYKMSPRSAWADTWHLRGVTADALALTLAAFWQSLDGASDVSLMVRDELGQYRAYQEDLSNKRAQHASARLSKARTGTPVIYRVENILRDTSAGTPLVSCFAGMLKG